MLLTTCQLNDIDRNTTVEGYYLCWIMKFMIEADAKYSVSLTISLLSKNASKHAYKESLNVRDVRGQVIL